MASLHLPCSNVKSTSLMECRPSRQLKGPRTRTIESCSFLPSTVRMNIPFWLSIIASMSGRLPWPGIAVNSTSSLRNPARTARGMKICFSGMASSTRASARGSRPRQARRMSPQSASRAAADSSGHQLAPDAHSASNGTQGSGVRAVTSGSDLIKAARSPSDTAGVAAITAVLNSPTSTVIADRANHCTFSGQGEDMRRLRGWTSTESLISSRIGASRGLRSAHSGQLMPH